MGSEKRGEARVDLQCASTEGSIDRAHTAENGEVNHSPDGKGQRPKLGNFQFIMVLTGFGMSFVGSQLQPLLFASIFPLVSSSFNSSNLLFWFTGTQQIAAGVAAPFAGSLAGLFGRKSVTPTAGGYLAGQIFSGVKMAVQELMAIAATAEIVPTEYRGYYIALVVASFLPFAPGSLYGALIAKHNWRYCACLVAVWNFWLRA
ncbi:hypothetical protein BDW66DRAFT_151192 [Aspergillus desertorum]